MPLSPASPVPPTTPPDAPLRDDPADAEPTPAPGGDGRTLTAEVARRARANVGRAALGTVLAVVGLGVAVVASLALGARAIPPDVVLAALVHGDPEAGYDAAVILTDRLPRTVLGVLVGLALGGSGVLMQGLTRNPLADPGILGVQLGAACGVVLGILAFGVSGLSGYFWFALVGAALSAAVVYLVAVRANSGDPAISLVLAGAAVAALLGSVITLVLVRDEVLYAHYRYWVVGQLTGRAGVLDEVVWFAVVGVVAALLLGPVLNVLALGDEPATALGVRPGRTRLLVAFVGVFLCAVATAAVGPVAFVGLVGAHVARLLVGVDHRWLVPLGMLSGALVLLVADVLGRLAPGGGEVEVGVMTALVGAPFFLLLARRRRALEL